MYGSLPWIFSTTPTIKEKQIILESDISNLIQMYRYVIISAPLIHWGRDKIDAISLPTFFKSSFLNENIWITIKLSLKFVLRIPINNIPALVQLMSWCQPGYKPLSEPMMVRLSPHICVIRHSASMSEHFKCQISEASFMTSCGDQKSWQPVKLLWRKHVWFCCHHCACWWPCTFRWQDICRHNNNQYTYITNTWTANSSPPRLPFRRR